MSEASAPLIDRKEKLRIPPQPIPKRPPQERIEDFDEVYLPLSLDVVLKEAARCLQCPAAPCVKACPLRNDIPGALLRLEQGDIIGAADKFRETNNAPEMCGRLCPQECFCEGACVVAKKSRAVAIGRLEAFVADYQRQRYGWPKARPQPPTGQRVVVVGSGPAGLAAAEELAKRGHGVTVFEAWPKPGGILRYGIPSFKLNKSIVDGKVAQLAEMGVQFVTGVRVGQDVAVDELLRQGYAAVFMGVGTGISSSLKVPGENLEGVYSATEFLARGNLPPEDLPPGMRGAINPGRRVVVIGGGDTAMDCVRTAVRLGARQARLRTRTTMADDLVSYRPVAGEFQVLCIYRRTEAEIRGREEERYHAKEEGVDFLFLATPVRFVGDEAGRLVAVRCVRMELGEPDESGRPRPKPIVGSEFEIDADCAVVAVGYRADPLIPQTTPGLEVDDFGFIVADPETGATSRVGIYAGGDDIRGTDWVATAIADGRRAAVAIDEYLRNRDGRRKAA